MLGMAEPEQYDLLPPLTGAFTDAQLQLGAVMLTCALHVLASVAVTTVLVPVAMDDTAQTFPLVLVTVPLVAVTLPVLTVTPNE
jgi:hypothetical protein